MRTVIGLVCVLIVGCGRTEPVPTTAASSGSPPAVASTPGVSPPKAASASPPTTAPEQAGGAPVSSAPLAGTVGGKPFVVKSAFAHEDRAFPATRTLTLYDEKRDCSRDAPEQKGARQIYVHVPWPPKGPSAVRVGGVIFDEKVTRGSEITQGRVEVIDPVPKVGGAGKVRIRVANAEAKVEGETEFVLCASSPH